MLQNIINIWIP